MADAIFSNQIFQNNVFGLGVISTWFTVTPWKKKKQKTKQNKTKKQTNNLLSQVNSTAGNGTRAFVKHAVNKCNYLFLPTYCGRCSKI